jgi:hypothetical protein
MLLDADRAALLEHARTLVKQFVGDQGGFVMFAIGLQPDRRFHLLQPTLEFLDQRAAFVEVLRTLITLARERQIVASVICTPLPYGKDQAAMFDLESANGRVLVLVRMRKRLFGGWSFDDLQFKNDGLRVFAAPADQAPAGDRSSSNNE